VIFMSGPALLGRNVRLLGTILGTVLVEQEGEWLLEIVERVRLLARAARQSGTVERVSAPVRAIPGEQAVVLRAFAMYFQLANIAEQQHRIRRRREDAHASRIARDSLEHAFELLADVPGDELARRAGRVSVRLVLTAHPTEASRRTVLLAHARIAEQLDRLDDPFLTAAGRRDVEERLAEEVTLLWQTDEVRRDRLRISDEIRNGLWFFEHSLFDAAEACCASGVAGFPAHRHRFASGPGSGATWTESRRPGRRRSRRRKRVRASWRASSTATGCAPSPSSSRRIGRSCA